MKTIHSALISVFDKTGLEPIVKKLNENNVQIISTGGTQEFIETLGIKVIPVEDLTSFPSILGGRVKTLHPHVFGGILNRRNNENDQKQLEKFGINSIDLVIVDLYPFEKTVNSGASHQEIIEKIDIGGISLIRAAAKNYQDVVIIPSVKEYAKFLDILNTNGAQTNTEERKNFAKLAFGVSSHYDSCIHKYFQEDELDELCLSFNDKTPLRYGENPHQKAAFFGNLESLLQKHHGKELSYNNILDIDAAVNLMNEFSEAGPTFGIFKHNNACGFASKNTVLEAYKSALEGDPVSAFGGVLICNKELDMATAQEINELFYEVLIAPSYQKEALELLCSKKNRIILSWNVQKLASKTVRSALNGILWQDRDTKIESINELNAATSTHATKAQLEDLVFANAICKHTKSNTIVLCKNKQLLASGTGQTSRVDALKQAIAKAKAFEFDLNGSCMASDAFFPFADCVEIANLEGIKLVVHPGGSINDKLSIDYCEQNNMAMYLTGIRHFKH